MKKTIVNTLTCAAALLPAAALAHTGAGQTSGFAAGFIHPAGGIDHLLAMVAVGIWATQLGGRALWLVPCAFAGTMAAGGLLGMSGIELPSHEQGITASLLIMGALIAGACRMPAVAGAALVGIFALFHGHAHGAEMPGNAGAVSYLAGFMLATALLHIAGILAGQLLKLRTHAMRIAGGAIAIGGVYMAVF